MQYLLSNGNSTYSIFLYYGDNILCQEELYLNSDLTSYYKDTDYTLNFRSSTLYFHNFRPVINLKAGINLSGNGTIDDPYVIVD